MQDYFQLWSGVELDEAEINHEPTEQMVKILKATEETVDEEAARLEEVFRKSNIVSLHSLTDFDDEDNEQGTDTLEEFLSDDDFEDDKDCVSTLEFSVVDDIWTDEKIRLLINVRGSKSAAFAGKDDQITIYQEILEKIGLKDQVTAQKVKKKWASMVDKYWKLFNLQIVSDLNDSKLPISETEEERQQNSERDKELLWPFYSSMKRVMTLENSLTHNGRTRKSPDFTWSPEITKKFIRMRVEKHPEISIKGNNSVYLEILVALGIADKVKVVMARKKWNYLVKRYQDEDLAGGERTWAFMKEMKNVMKYFKDYSKTIQIRSRASPEFLWPNELTKRFIELRTARHSDFTEGVIQNTYMEIMEELGLEHILTANQLRKKWNYLIAKHKELSCTTTPEGMSSVPSTWPFFDDMEKAIATIPENNLKYTKANLANIWTPEILKKFIALRGSRNNDSNQKVSSLFDEILKELGLTNSITAYQARKKWNYLYTKYMDLSSPDVNEYARLSWPYYTAMYNAVGSLPLSQLPARRYLTTDKQVDLEEKLKKARKSREYECFLCGQLGRTINDFFIFEHDQRLFHTQKTVLEIISHMIEKKTFNLHPFTCLCTTCSHNVNEADSVIDRHEKIRQETFNLYMQGQARKHCSDPATPPEITTTQQPQNVSIEEFADKEKTIIESLPIEKEQNVTYSKRGRKRRITGPAIKTEPLEEEFLDFDDESEDDKKKKRSRKKRGRPLKRTTLIGRGLGDKYPSNNKRKQMVFKGTKTYNCLECKLKFKRYTDLVTHRKQAHTVIDTSTLEVHETMLDNGIITFFNKDKANNLDTSHPCKECPKQFLRRDDLWYHQEMAHTDGKGRAKTAFKDRSYDCEECHLKFLFKYKLKMHINNKHLNDAGQSANDFTCGQCGCKLGSLPGLTFHMRKHHDKSLAYRKNNEYLCSDCGFMAASSKKLHEHQAAQCSFSTKPKVQCEVCGKTVLKVSLKMHKAKMHSDFKEQCDRCGERYATKTDLLRHINVVHLRIMLYKCPQCQEKFATSDSLRYHRVKMHEKPSFYCQGCGKCYKRIGELNTHIKRTHNDRRKAEVCQYCGKEYYDRSGLRNHLVNKHNVPAEMTYSENYLRKKRVDGLPLAKHMEKRDNKHQPQYSILQQQLQVTPPQLPLEPLQHHLDHNPNILPRVDEAAEAARNLTAYPEMTTAGSTEEDSALVVTEITESPQVVEQTVLVDPLTLPSTIMHHHSAAHVQPVPMNMHHMQQQMQQHNMRLNVLYQMNMHHPAGSSHINM